MRARSMLVAAAMVGCGGGGGGGQATHDAGGSNLCAMVAAHGDIHESLLPAGDAGTCPSVLPIVLGVSSDGTALLEGVGATGACAVESGGCGDVNLGSFIVKCAGGMEATVQVQPGPILVELLTLPNGCVFVP